MENGKIIRADKSFVELAKKMAKENDMSLRQITKEFAKMIKTKKINNGKIDREIKF